MNDLDKRDGQQIIIDEALAAMGFNCSADGFDSKGVNLAEFCRITGLTRSKARTHLRTMCATWLWPAKIRRSILPLRGLPRITIPPQSRRATKLPQASSG